MVKGILLHKQDDVITLTGPAAVGERLIWLQDGEEKGIVVSEEIPIYHKAACKEIKKGGYVHKYGEVIGAALSDIHPGQWVHTANLESVSLMTDMPGKKERINEKEGERNKNPPFFLEIFLFYLTSMYF